MDESFVHLPYPPRVGGGPSSLDHDSLLPLPSSYRRGGENDGAGRHMLKSARHLDALVRCATGRNGADDDESACLCRACVERVAKALDADAERLRTECSAYVLAVAAEEDRQRSMRRALVSSLGLADEVSDEHGPVNPVKHVNDNTLIGGALSMFEEEIETLAAACDEHEQELRHLRGLLEEQKQLSSFLIDEEGRLLSDMNDLDIEARNFDSAHRRLAFQCADVHREVSALSRVRIHRAMFDLEVDERGLRYPLINDLRLAYRPKGDLEWSEINAAWAEAARLLMFACGTATFLSRDMRIVPLSKCAKIIEATPCGQRKIHNLGWDFDSGGEDQKHGAGGSNRKRTKGGETVAADSLCAFHALLYQLLSHLEGKSKAANGVLAMPPFVISRSQIGAHELANLQEKDDSGWSAVIHCMASNLKWLAEKAG